jgi:phosphatidylserine/phosphatidylglycerophosphate/cardiolipin synthase-like enzyme
MKHHVRGAIRGGDPLRRRVAVVLMAAVLAAGATASAGADLVRILHGDGEAAQARVDLLQQARQEINLAYYLVGDDDIPLVVLALLRDAARQGIAVRLLIDGHDANNLVPRALAAHLLREGVQIKEFHPRVVLRSSWTKNRMHDKLLIVDGEHLITGGRNLKNEYFGLDCRNFVDRDVYLRGCAAAAAECYFMARWNSEDVCPVRLSGRQNRHIPEQQSHPDLNDACDENAICRAGLLLDEARRSAEECHLVRFHTGYDWSADARQVACVRFLHDLPGVKKSQQDGIASDMLELLSGARCSLVLETPYMALTSEMNRLLTELRCRGVSVTILTNSFETNDHHSAQSIYENHKRWYLRRGIQLWELRGCDHLHAKAAVIDGQIALIGSYNFDELSEKRNSEVAVAIYDQEIAALLLGSIHVHLQRAYQIGRNAHPIGYSTRYPGADRKQLREMRGKRLTAPLIKHIL